MGPTEDWKDNIEYMAELFPAPYRGLGSFLQGITKIKERRILVSGPYQGMGGFLPE